MAIDVNQRGQQSAEELERRRVLLAELESDRDGSGMTTVVGLAVIFLGLFTTFFLAYSSEGPQPGGWLSGKLGEGVDVHFATQVIGLGIALLGFLLAAYGIRQLAAIRRRYRRDYLGEAP